MRIAIPDRMMRTLLRSVVLSFPFLFHQVLEAAPPENYYSATAGLTGGALKNTLHGIISNHTVIPYSELISPIANVWRDPANPANILLIYSNTSVPAASSWNREHIWPRSRGNSELLGPDDSDLFHVFPSDIAVNAERGSLYFDESDPGDPAYRIPAHPLAPQSSRDSDSFQPPPQERGDVARAIFYMDVRYDGQEPFTTDMELVSFPPSGPQMGRLNTLLLWHQQDPPDDAERARNDLIFSTYQNNRNPFIDHPEFVEAIWGVGLPNGGGSRPIARASVVSKSAVEAPQTQASFRVSLNQFAGTGGLTVSFSMSGTAGLSDYGISGNGVTYDPLTGLGTVFIPENFSSVLVSLVPVVDGIVEDQETVVVTLNEGENYTVVPDGSSNANLEISDTAKLPATWNFNSGAPYANPLGSNAGAGTISFSGWLGTVSSFTGTSGNALALVGNAGNNSWIELDISMTGYTNLVLNFATRGTSSGYNVGTWSASVDGINFMQLPNVNTATRNTSFVNRVVDFSGLPQLANVPEVTLRYTLSGATSSNGNNRIDELSVSASPLVTGDDLRTVSIAAVDSVANEATLDAGIFAVQINGAAPEGGLAVNLDLGSGSAVAPELSDSDYQVSGLTSYNPATRNGVVVIPEGQIAALLTVTPLSDSQIEGPETVIATLLTDPGYLLASNNSAIISILSPLINDSFVSSVPMAGELVASTGTNVGATRETGEPYHAPFSQTGGRSVWWNWTAPTDGVLQVTTNGSNFDTLLGIYTGSRVDGLSVIGVDDDGGNGLASRLVVRVKQGITYAIAVDGYGQSVGTIALDLSLRPLPLIQISALSPVAKERGGVPATIRFTMDAPSLLPTLLNLQFGGTALSGQDYVTVPASAGSWIIPAGQTVFDLGIQPQADENFVENVETIVIGLAVSENYRAEVSPENSVTVLLEDDSPYSEDWLAEHPTLAAEDAILLGDSDGDGLPTFLEYLFDRDPTVPDGGSVMTLGRETLLNPVTGMEERFHIIRIIRRQDGGGIPIMLEKSETLSTGSWQPVSVLPIVTPIAGTSTEELLYRIPEGSGIGTGAFFRLRAGAP